MALKQYKPNTPGQRGLVLVDKTGLYKGKPVKKLTEGLNKSGGRNNSGKITMWQRGGGHKRRYRIIDFKRNKKDLSGTVERIEYDPNRSSFVALIKYEDGLFNYILAPNKVKENDIIVSSLGIKPLWTCQTGFINICNSSCFFAFSIKSKYSSTAFGTISL